MSKEGVIPSQIDACPLVVPEVPNTSVHISPENFKRLSPFLEQVGGFVGRNSRHMGAVFKREYSQIRTADLSQDRIWNHLETNNIHLPQYRIYDQVNGCNFLNLIKPHVDMTEDDAAKRIKYINNTYKIDPNNLLLVFQYPRPLAQFWDKEHLKFGKGEKIGPHVKPALRELLQNQAEEIDPQLAQRINGILEKREPYSRASQIEWGRFLGPLTALFWDEMIEYESGDKLSFRKINGDGIHNTSGTNYHYTIEVGKPGCFPKLNRKKGK